MKDKRSGNELSRMSSNIYERPVSVRQSSLRLENGSRVAVMGGGPAGSFFSYFLLELAEKAGIGLKVDIYEPRDFSIPAPRGCNMCAGVISETLVQNLATEGIALPASVVQKAINSYVLHTDLGSQRIDAAFHEKRIGAMFEEPDRTAAGKAKSRASMDTCFHWPRTEEHGLSPCG